MLCRHHHHHRASTVDVDDDAVSPIPPLRPHADNDNGTTAPPVPLDAALGLQALGHTVDIYTSHHDPNHCTLPIHHNHPALPAPLFLLRSPAPEHDIFFVDQLSTYKLLAHGAFVEGNIAKAKQALYRYPMEYLEEVTNILSREQPTLISLNRFEMKKNAALAIEAFALLRDKASTQHLTRNMRLVLAGGYDPRLEDNIRTLNGLVERARSSKLSFNVITPLQSTTTTTTARTLKQERGRGRHVAALSCQRRRRCVATHHHYYHASMSTTTPPPLRVH
ncbi:hypothetical protein EV363DRAFT_1561100 [Boletus edulis]|nr:hypothetical protein EV363DRAFT_1561100 [Boletus edulis]